MMIQVIIKVFWSFCTKGYFEILTKLDDVGVHIKIFGSILLLRKPACNII